MHDTSEILSLQSNTNCEHSYKDLKHYNPLAQVTFNRVMKVLFSMGAAKQK